MKCRADQDHVTFIYVNQINNLVYYYFDMIKLPWYNIINTEFLVGK